MEMKILEVDSRNILSNQVDINIRKEIDYDEKLFDRTLAKIEFHYTQSGIEWSGLGIKLDVMVW